jgi:hypothetical protein
MLASTPASMLNRKYCRAGIPYPDSASSLSRSNTPSPRLDLAPVTVVDAVRDQQARFVNRSPRMSFSLCW